MYIIYTFVQSGLCKMLIQVFEKISHLHNLLCTVDYGLMKLDLPVLF